MVFSIVAVKRKREADSCQPASQLNHHTFHGIPVTLLHWVFSSFFNANHDALENISSLN